jgi:hypothetical protein
MRAAVWKNPGVIRISADACAGHELNYHLLK